MPSNRNQSNKRGQGMADPWLKSIVDGFDPRAELMVIENPGFRESLDSLMLGIWPSVRDHLESTGHIYTPTDEMALETKGSTKLVRTMSWMLHDVSQAIHRGILECSRDHWMLSSEFFLSMPAEVDIRFVMEMIGNSRFGGNPPELTIQKHTPANHYQIRFHGGSGESWGPESDKKMLQRIRTCIDVNVAMNELTLDDEWDEDLVGEFLTKAYEIYEAY